MKAKFFIISIFSIVLFFMTAHSSYAQGSLELYLPIDYIELPGNEIEPSGDVWECNILSNQGVTRATIEAAITNALDDPDISAFISAMELTSWEQNIEGEISITFTANTTGDVREITIFCGSNEYPLSQSFIGSPLYSLSANKQTIAKGESVIFTLSGSVDYAKYILLKGGVQYGYPVPGSGNAITFSAEGDGDGTGGGLLRHNG